MSRGWVGRWLGAGMLLGLVSCADEHLLSFYEAGLGEGGTPPQSTGGTGEETWGGQGPVTGGTGGTGTGGIVVGGTGAGGTMVGGGGGAGGTGAGGTNTGGSNTGGAEPTGGATGGVAPTGGAPELGGYVQMGGTSSGPECPALYTVMLEYSTGVTDRYTSRLEPMFRLTNLGAYPLNLGPLRIRYWFTGEYSLPRVSCRHADIGCENVSLGAFPAMAQLADTFVEISFERLGLPPGQSMTVEVGIQRDDNNQYDQFNDYSFSGQSTFAIWSHVVLYCAGYPILGIPPLAG